MNKRGAMELSIGTIVVIVLAMAMLIGGLVLVKNIIGGSNKVVDMTNDQLENQIRNLFGEEKTLVVFPASKIITIKQGVLDGFGIGIKNLDDTAGKYTYTVDISDPDLQRKCGVNPTQVREWIVTGRSESNINLGPGIDTARKVLINVPKGAALCTFRLSIDLKKDGSSAGGGSDAIDIQIKA